MPDAHCTGCTSYTWHGLSPAFQWYQPLCATRCTGLNGMVGTPAHNFAMRCDDAHSEFSPSRYDPMRTRYASYDASAKDGLAACLKLLQRDANLFVTDVQCW